MTGLESSSRYSLVVLAYNRPVALADCLESIARLDWPGPPLEVIVVDDGSTPPCREVAAAFERRLRVVYDYRANGGVAAARNRGLALATGDRVAFVADDYRLPADYLTRVDRFFREHPEAQVISFQIRPAGPSPLLPVQRLYLRLALGQELADVTARTEIVASFTLPASRAAVFRRELFDLVGGFDEALRVGEDGELGRRLAARGIPVHMFFQRYVDHLERLGPFGYFAQRLRYGHSYVRVLDGGPARRTLERFSWAGVSVCAARKLAQWWSVAGRLGERPRFVALSLPLFGFLCCFYLGSLLELRARRRRE